MPEMRRPSLLLSNRISELRWRVFCLRPQGSPGSVTVALKTMTGKMQRDEHQHQHTDDGEEDLDS
jgi:hypothetical protein